MPKRISHKNFVLDTEHLNHVVKAYREQPEVAFDVETRGPDRGVPHVAPVTWLTIAAPGMAHAIPMGHINGDTLISKATRRKNKETGKFDPIPAVWSPPPVQLRPSQVWPAFEDVFMNPDRTLIAHGSAFDLPAIAKYYDGKIAPGKKIDTLVLQWLLNENRKRNSLKEMVKDYFNHDYDQEHVGRNIDLHPFTKVGHYGFLDVRYTWYLRLGLLPQIERFDLQKVWDLEMQIADVVARMRLVGAKVSREELEGLDEDFSAELIDLEGAVYKAAGQEFNLNSNPQKQKILYGPKSEGGQGLAVKKRTDTGAPSCDSDALEYHLGNPVAKALVEYAEVSKLHGTYVKGYLGEEGNPKKPCIIYNGRVHTDLVQYGTVTGRFSSRSPNLQNIPAPGTEKGKKIRGLFDTEEGESLVVADYGQIELVVLAHYSRAKALVDGFNNGIDAHTLTAAKVYGVDFDQVEKSMRQTAKGINFAVVYGAGPDKVASMAGLTVKEAKHFLGVHEMEFPEVYDFKASVLKTARKRKPPYIRTIMGRYRRLPALNYSDKGLRGYAERQAVNSLIQGSAADLIKIAMVRLDRMLPPEAQLVLSVHDELVTRCPTEMAEEVREIQREAMLGDEVAGLLSVPMTADFNIVKRWSEAK